jgi:hypothetical protein
VARVSPAGLVTAVAPGTVTITASSENTSATAVITVIAARRPARRFALLGGGVAVAAVAGALWLFGPLARRTAPAAEPADSAPRPGTLDRATDTQPLSTVPPAVPQPPETTTFQPAAPTSPARPRERPPGGTRDSSESVVATALASANSARAQAVDAGAGAADLAQGDAELQRALDLRRAGRRAEAFEHLRTAAGLYADAESAAAAARIAAQRRAPPPDTAKVAPPPTPAPLPEPPAVVNPEPEIRRTIAAYARALESRDLNALTRVFPDLPPSQADQWQQFFTGAEDIRAEWRVIRITPAGNRAEARVAMTLRFRRADNHGPDRQPFEVRMQLSHRDSAWVITAIQ